MNYDNKFITNYKFYINDNTLWINNVITKQVPYLGKLVELKKDYIDMNTILKGFVSNGNELPKLVEEQDEYTLFIEFLNFLHCAYNNDFPLWNQKVYYLFHYFAVDAKIISSNFDVRSILYDYSHAPEGDDKLMGECNNNSGAKDTNTVNKYLDKLINKIKNGKSGNKVVSLIAGIIFSFEDGVKISFHNFDLITKFISFIPTIREFLLLNGYYDLWFCLEYCLVDHNECYDLEYDVVNVEIKNYTVKCENKTYIFHDINDLPEYVKNNMVNDVFVDTFLNTKIWENLLDLTCNKELFFLYEDVKKERVIPESMIPTYILNMKIDHSIVKKYSIRRLSRVLGIKQEKLFDSIDKARKNGRFEKAYKLYELVERVKNLSYEH